jgi:hypothetical protein
MFLFLGLARNNETSKNKNRVLKIFALIALTGSVLSMSNGLFAAWLAVLYVFLLPNTLKMKIVFLLTSTVLSAAYFVDYSTPGSHKSPISTLISFPLEVIEYFLAYLGGPIYFFTNKTTLAIAAGFAVLLVFIVLSVTTWKHRKNYGLAFAVLAFAFYIVFSAGITAAGRASFGTEQAFASRYQTPVLALWSILIALATPYFWNIVKRWPIFATSLCLIAFVLFLPAQIDGAKGENSLRSSRELATLALSLNIEDSEVLGTVYYDQPRLHEISEQAKNAGLTVLSQDKYVGLLQSLGSVTTNLKSENCNGWFDIKSPIAGSKALRVSGWVVGPEFPDYGFSNYKLLNNQQQIVGFIVRGTFREDLFNQFGVSWGESGFTGYLAENHNLSEIYISSDNWKCNVPLMVSDAAN